MPLIRLLMAIVGFAALGVAALYLALTLLAQVLWRLRRLPPVAHLQPPLTVLKPLCGAEPGLYEHLRSFCQQDYPQFQIVFGVHDAADPALLVVQRLVQQFPELALEVVVNPLQHGSNRKISNLINMLPHARHDILVLADSDTFVGPGYLASVTAPLCDPRVGLVTCLYSDVPTAGGWSRLGAMYINEWYMPTVLLAWLFGHQSYVSGQTLCVRHVTLRAIGGLEALANQLADDYRLGELVRGLGLQIVLSRYTVKAEHHEPDLVSLTGHELRWMRTLRILRPRSFRWIFLSFSVPLAVLGLILALLLPLLATIAWTLFWITVAGRVLLHFAYRMDGGRPLLSDLWLLPARELLICWVWCRSFFRSRVIWRGSEFDVGADGVMRRLS
jgi:ceramide glucosyltransferase